MHSHSYDAFARPKILLVPDHSASLATVSARLAQTEGQSAPLPVAVETRQALGEAGALSQFDLVIADWDQLSATDRDRLSRSLDVNSRTRPILVSAGRCRKDFVRLFGDKVLTNLIAVNHGAIEAADLVASVQKLLTRDIFGLEKYFQRGIDRCPIRVTRSSQTTEVIAQAEAFASRFGIHPRLVSAFGAVADELVLNAVYNAPVDRDGQKRYEQLDRAVPVSLDPNEACDVTFAFDGERLGISVTDPCGSLEQEPLLENLARCFRRGADQVSPRPGGAGLGFYQVLEAVSHLVINVDPGRKTELIALIRCTPSYRQFAELNKSFNIFMTR